MSARNAARRLHNNQAIIADPGNGGTITVDKSTCTVNLVSTTTETRTLALPTRQSAIVTFHHQTDGGDITLTVASPYNEFGDTTFVFSDVGQTLTLQSHVTAAGVFFWRVLSSYLVSNFASQTQTLTTGAGVGITSGTGTVYKTSILRVGSIIYTTIYIDLTGLASIATDGDIIGVNGGGAAHIGRITAAQNGTIESMCVTCTETPAGGLADIDIFRATVGTGVQDDAISGITGQATTGAVNITATGTIKCATAVPAAGDYLYLCAGAGSGAGTYTAGKLVIELIGY